MRVLKCLPTFPTDFYWYGGKRSKPGRPPKRVQKQLEEVDAEVEQLNTNNSSTECECEGETNYQLRNNTDCMLPVLSSASIHSNKSTEPVTATVRKKSQKSSTSKKNQKKANNLRIPKLISILVEKSTKEQVLEL